MKFLITGSKMIIKSGNHLLIYACFFIFLMSLVSWGCESKNKDRKKNTISTFNKARINKSNKESPKKFQTSDSESSPGSITNLSRGNIEFHIFENEGTLCDECIVNDVSLKDSAWYGLFNKGNGLFELKNINVDVELKINPITDEEEIRLKLVDGFQSLYVMGGYDILNNKMINSIFFDTIVLKPSDSISVPGTNFIFITDSIRMVQSFWADIEPGHDDIPLLEFQLIVSNNDKQQILIEKACGTPKLWIGCLDKDNIPDLIFTAEENEGLTKIISLFLSVESTGNRLYRQIAIFRQHLGPA